MTLAILQARMTSTRLPGKVMADLHGQPMILRQLERLRRSELISTLVVATSTNPTDDPLVELLEREGVLVRRGPLADVASRFAAVVAEFDEESFVRLTADCPLTDPVVVDRVIAQHRASGTDYTSNTVERTYPQGLDAECARSDAFMAMMSLDLSEAEREHVTLALYGRPDRFSTHQVTQDPDRSQLRWTVDRPDDLAFVQAVYGELYDADPAFGQAEILELLDRRPDLDHTN